MTSEIRTNSIKSRTGLSTVTFADTGIIVSGIVTATSFSGDGIVTINNNANNRVITGSGTANTLEGESTLTYDGNKLKFGGGSRALDNGYYDDIVIDNSDTTSGEAGGSGISIISGNASWGGLIFGDNDEHQRGYIKYAHQNEYMELVTASGGGQVRIESGGSVGIGSCIHHLSDTDTNFGFPSNDSYIVRIAGNSRIYTNNSEPIWHRRDVSAGVSTQTMLLNYNNASGSGCALAFAPSTNYASRHSSIEVVNEGNNNMNMRFKVTDANNNAHALERMRITKDGEVLIGATVPYSSGYTQLTVGNNTIQNTGITIASKSADGYSRIHFADNTSGAASYAGWITYSHADDALLFSTNGSGSDKARLTSAGNLVIGHTSANNKLQIGNTGHSGYCIAANSPSYGAVIQVGDGATPGTAAALWIRNLNNGGTPTACFRVQGDGTAHFGDQASTGKYNDGNTGCSWYDAKDSWQQGQSGTLGWSMMYFNKIGGTNVDNRIMQFNSSGSNIGYINRNGGNTQFATSSDYRLKKDIVALPNGLERVKQLRPVAFKWIADNSDMEGFVAHEAQEICPYAVTGKKDEVATEDNGDRKKGDMIVQSVDYGEFTPLLTAAMQELIAKVETLEQENIALRARVTNLEGN